MKKAVVYYSMSGNTEYVAKKVSEKIGADLIKIEPEETYPDKGFKKYFWGGKSAIMGDKPKLKPYEFNSLDYDLIVFGTPIWASNITPPIRSFVDENINNIQDKRIAIFACYSGGGAEKAIEKFKKEIQINELEAKLILIDPKDKESPENLKKIEQFCDDL